VTLHFTTQGMTMMTVIQEMKVRNNWRHYSLRLALVLGLAIPGLIVHSARAHADEIVPASRQAEAPPPPVPDDWPSPPH